MAEESTTTVIITTTTITITEVAVDCSERDKLDIPIHLLRASVVNWYLVVVAGTIVNALAVWCVSCCPKTKPPVKLLLLTVFLSTLTVCLFTGPLRAEILRAELACESQRITFLFYVVTMDVYSILAQVERMGITILAVVRAVAVWSPQRHSLRMKEAVGMVVAVVLYCCLTGVGLLGTRLMGWVTETRTVRAFTFVFFFLNTTLPILVTAASYFTIMFAVRRNKRRLEKQQHGHRRDAEAATGGSGGGGRMMNQATKALLAMSVSNLAYGLPHGIFHLVEGTSHTQFLLAHIFFYHHFIVDPLVFLWFNESHRQRVKGLVARVTQGCLSCCSASMPVIVSPAFHLLRRPSLSTSSTAQMKVDFEKRSQDDVREGVEDSPPEVLKRVRDNNL